MSLRPTLRAASRALAIRSRPALPRHEALGWSLAKRRYADDAVQKNTSKPVDAAAVRRIKEDLDEEAVMDQLEAALANLPKEQPRRKARKGTDEVRNPGYRPRCTLQAAANWRRRKKKKENARGAACG